MKNLEIVCQRAEITLRTAHYQSFLNTPVCQRMLEAALQKSQVDQLSLLQYLSLAIIQQCQQWDCLLGETSWQNAATDCIARLRGKKWTRDQRRIWLHQADDLIEIACVTQTVRRDIHQTAKDRQIPSVTFEQAYQQARQIYQEQRDALIQLEDQVKQIGKTYAHLTGKPNAVTLAHSQGITQSLPAELPTYSKASTEMRLSDRYVEHKIRVEKEARVVYQELCQDVIKTPIQETLAQQIHDGKQRLTHYTARILKTAETLQQEMQQDHLILTTHRHQILTAHEKRIAQLSGSLEQMIQTCRACLPQHPENQQLLSHSSRQALTHLVDTAQEVKRQLHSNPVAIDSAAVQEKILAINVHRRNYENSITGWYAFFSRFSKAQQQREQMNRELKTHIADLVVPACNLSDREGAVTEDQLKAQQQRIQDLENQKTRLQAKTEKVREIQIPTAISLSP
jgi:hypothetical protein